jgi:hypothetical protein
MSNYYFTSHEKKFAATSKSQMELFPRQRYDPAFEKKLSEYQLKIDKREQTQRGDNLRAAGGKRENHRETEEPQFGERRRARRNPLFVPQVQHQLEVQEQELQEEPQRSEALQGERFHHSRTAHRTDLDHRHTEHLGGQVLRGSQRHRDLWGRRKTCESQTSKAGSFGAKSTSEDFFSGDRCAPQRERPPRMQQRPEGCVKPARRR